MKTKIRNKLFMPLLLFFSFCALVGGAFAISSSTETVSASPRYSSAKCLTYGRTTTNNGSSSSGCPSNFKIYMYGSSVSGTKTIYQDDLFDWSQYNFSVETSKVSNHLSFKLYKNGSLWMSKSLSGNGNTVLYSTSLPDGDYELEYSCNYRANIFQGYTTYTYTYRFEADKTDPSYTLKAGGSNISSGSYTNKQIVYTGIDPNFSYIHYKAPYNSSYYNYYGTSYTVSATASNNGWWYFQGYDLMDSVSTQVSVYLDTVAPVGKVTNASGYTISNGGYTNSAIKYTATDACGISYYQVLKPGSSSWTSYSSGTSLSGTNGWYKFRAVDYAGNISTEYKVYYDNGAPSYTLYGGTSSKSSGSYTNASYVKYVASDSYSGISNCYVRMPGSSSYSTYASGTQLATEGTYYFYAVDKSGNATSTVSITLDKTAPVGTLYAGTSARASGSYTNASYIKYTASDSVSGVSAIYVRKPGSSSYVSYTSGTQLTAEGTYYFYSVDRAGNYSTTVNITLDRTLPVGTLYGGTTSKPSGAYTNAGYVKYTASDSNSGVANYYVRMPNSSYYTSYAPGTQLATEGTYYFYSVDRSGNASSTVNITLDKTKPTGILYGGTSSISSGDYTNASYVRFVPSDTYGVANIYVKKPGASGYVSYASGAQLTTEGTYDFYCVDRAGNVSDHYTATLDRHVPAAQLYVDDKPVSNNCYTNGAHIRFECSEKTYVKLPGKTEFSDYIDGVEYYRPGKYVFYGISDAGTSSGYYTIVIDRTIKTLEALNVVDGVTNGDARLTWTDGDPNEFAPIAKVTVNGKPYTKDSTIYTIDTGVYNVHVTDAAGNTWETQFSSTKKNMVTDTLQQEYFEAHDADGNYFTFATYDSAFAFAVERERGYVTSAEWISDVWDTGLAMDGKDSVNAMPGTYFIYKKSGNPEENVAYFTEERLMEVFAEYAKIDLNSYFYWEKEPAPIAEGENMFTYSDTKTILGDSITFGSNIACLVDGEPYADSVYETEGEHLLTVMDEWGNTCDYNLIVIRRAPDIMYALNEGSANKANFGRVYRFSDMVTISIHDEYDEMAMFSIFDENGSLMGKFMRDDTFALTESGGYTVEAVNHFGKSEIFSLIISRSAPTVTINENTEDKRLEVAITESSDKEAHMATLEIFKSVDGGETWELLTCDDYGTEIKLGALAYKFRTTGIFKVVITDEFRTGIDAVTEVIDYVQPEPVGVLKGVENEGYTNGKVSFTWNDEAKVELKKDGDVVEYKSGTELSEDGKYELTFENFDGFKKVYTFIIDTIAPEVVVRGVNGDNAARVMSSDLVVLFTEDGATGKLFKDGVVLGDYASGTLIKDSAKYSVVVTDLALNKTEVEFEIDKFVDFEIDINDKGLSNAVTIKGNEPLEVILTKDGEIVEYAIGDTITTPGEYNVSLADETFNHESFSFTIVKQVSTVFEHNFDDMPGFEKVLVNGEDTRLNYGTLLIEDDGEYEVCVVANGVEHKFNITIDTAAPGLVLAGAENGKTTNTDVSVSWTDEDVKSVMYKLNGGEAIAIESGAVFSAEGLYEIFAQDVLGNVSSVSFKIDKTLNFEIEVGGTKVSEFNRTNKQVVFTNNEPLYVAVTKNGTEYAYAFGIAITEEGHYEAKVFDDFGNSVILKFDIDKTAPEILLGGAENGKTTGSEVTVSWTDKDIKSVVCKFNDGEAVAIENGAVFDGEGRYEITAKDDLGNTSNATFTIDKTLDYDVLFGGEDANGSDRTNREVTLLNNEDLHIIASKDGERIVYEFGQTLTQEGLYEIRIFDDYNNEIEFAITVDKTAPTIVLNGVEDGGVGHGDVTITELSENGTVEVYKDGEQIEYNLGDTLSDYANYEVKVKDDLGNERSYSFTLKYKMPGLLIAAIVIGSVAIVGVGVFFILKKKKIIK